VERERRESGEEKKRRPTAPGENSGAMLSSLSLSPHPSLLFTLVLYRAACAAGGSIPVPCWAVGAAVAASAQCAVDETAAPI
jgi:hypothetical protein